MFRFIFFLLIVLALALLFAWVADNPGTIFVQWEWLANQMGRPGEEIGVPLTLAIALMVGLIALSMFTFGVLKGIFGFPSLLGRFFENRRREKGYKALSQGLIAASSGDADTARSRAKESTRLLGDDPLVALLGTQTALLEGKRDEALQNYQKMLANDDTRMVALRGLFLEAERKGVPEAARHYAEEAVREAPSLPWAGNAKLRYQAADADWDAAIQTLEANRSAGLVDKETAKRHRAVLLTAKAMTVEQADPTSARKLAREAHKLAKDLVPAATTYARAASRQGDIKGASKVIEACWKVMPHPELAEAYATVRAGDSVKDRMERAKKLASLKANHPEGSIAIANAAIDARDWEGARAALEPVLTTNPTRRACLLMADIEEGQHGDQGRMRDWLARAVRAPADKAWTADGHVSEEWLPLSPVTGELDAFEWKVPVEELDERKIETLTVEQLREAAIPIAAAGVGAAASVEKTPVEAEDAEVIEAETAYASKSAPNAEVSEAKSGTNAASANTRKADKTGSENDADAAKASPSASDQQSTSTAAEAATETKTDDTPDDAKAETPEKTGKADEPKADGKKADEADNSNVVSIESAAATRQEKLEDGDASKTAPHKLAANTDRGDKDSGDGQVTFPLGRRPDDPGVHPDKQPPKKGFKLF